MYTYKNNLRATLHFDLAADQNVIWLAHLVTSDDAATRLAAWPTCDSTHTFNLTLMNSNTYVFEIVKCTAVSANEAEYIAFNISRAQEGTVALAHSKDVTFAENRVTAAYLNTITDAIVSTQDATTTHTAQISALNTTVDALSTTLLGSIISVLASDTYVPNGCIPCDGAEYSATQFPTLYTTYLTSGKFLTCSYAQWAAQVALTGNCAKFAVDTVNSKFKVPLIKDGDSITQAASAAELGRSVKAGLPNATGAPGMYAVNAKSTPATGVFKAKVILADNTGYTIGGDGNTAISAIPAIDLRNSSSVYSNDVTTVIDEQVRLRHFVVVASAQNNSSIFDWSAYMAALANKLNTDLSNADTSKYNIVLQRLIREETGMTSTTAVIPNDDTIPQITEGALYMSMSITPKKANSKIDVEVNLNVTCYNATSHLFAALFKDSVSDAVAASAVTNGGAGFFVPLQIKKTVSFPDTNTHTLSVRVGVPNNSYPISINGTSGRLLGGALTSSMILTEYAV